MVNEIDWPSVGFAELDVSGSSDGSSLIDSGVVLDVMRPGE